MSYKQYKVIDCHCDTLTQFRDGETLSQGGRAVSLPKMKAYGGYAQLFAAWISDVDETPYQTLKSVIDRFYTELSAHAADVMQILSADDFEKAFKTQRVGAMLAIENGKAIEGSLSKLREAYTLGVRAMTLTWNGANEIADGIGEKRGNGLSDFGKTVVSEMNHLGMMIDVSHLSEQGFYDVLALSSVPVMASHSNSRAMGSHLRNLSDEQIKLLAEKGGVTGLNLYPPFLSDTGRADLYDCVRHVMHIINVGGEDCLALGSDFDGFSTEPVQGLADPGEYVKLFRLLKEQGISENTIDKITHKNFIRFSKDVLH